MYFSNINILMWKYKCIIKIICNTLLTLSGHSIIILRWLNIYNLYIMRPQGSSSPGHPYNHIYNELCKCKFTCHLSVQTSNEARVNSLTLQQISFHFINSSDGNRLTAVKVHCIFFKHMLLAGVWNLCRVASLKGQVSLNWLRCAE